jgi:hypothetical protein
MKEGGGTRVVDIEKTANKEEIIKIADCFFLMVNHVLEMLAK